MITLTINKIPTLLLKAFTAADVETILEFVRSVSEFYTGETNSALECFAFKTKVLPRTHEPTEGVAVETNKSK